MLSRSNAIEKLMGNEQESEKIEKIERLLEKSTESYMKAQDGNEIIYHRAQKEAYSMVIKILND